MDPLEMLPEEMWGTILDKLSTLDDLHSAYNTCQLWRSLITKKRAEWMFPGVLPSLIKYLPKADILNCRQVSKCWNKVIDSHLESNQPSITATGDPLQLSFHTPQRTLTVDINSIAEKQNKTLMEALQCFQTKFSSATQGAKNPFVSRSLQLTVTKLNLTVLTFFEKFGSNLWSLQLSIFQTRREDIVTQIIFFKFIWSILGLVPNLKKLILETEQTLDVLNEMFTDEDRKVQLDQVRLFLGATLVPPLHQLDNLQLNVNNQWLRQVLESAYAPQLTKFVRTSPFSFVPKNLTNAREVIWYYRNCCAHCHINELRKLNAPSLERLSIAVVECAPWKSPADRLFAELETFKTSLKYLCLYWRWCEPTFPARLDLPLVEELSIQIGHCRNPTLINFSFLATLKSLRKLTCFFWNPMYLQLLRICDCGRRKRRRRPVRQGVDLKYHLDYDKHGAVYNSNVWELVPSLKTIEVHVVDWLGETGAKKVWIYSRVERDKKLASLNSQVDTLPKYAGKNRKERCK